MQFTVHGVEYDTRGMHRFSTGNPYEPTIYIDQNCRVFVKRIKDGEAFVEAALTTEILAFAERYGITELGRATRHLNQAATASHA